MSKIYELPLSFRLLKKYIRFTYTNYYGKFIVLGKENIPKEGPVIFAPNHLNALMDALIVQSVSPDNYVTIFLARADVFKNKAIAKFMRSAKIMPAFRIRDGIENLEKNADVFEKCVQVLDHKQAMGIMPEGNQELERRIRPLVKGIFRIAFSAQKKIGDTSSLKIIPIGIEFEDILKFGENVIVNIGQPIYVQEYMELYNSNPPVALNEIKKRLKTELENLSVHLDTNDFYNCFETSVYVANNAMLLKMGLEDNLVNKFIARREIGKTLVQSEKNSKEKISNLNELCEKLNKELKELNFKSKDISHQPDNISTKILNFLWLFISLPVFIVGFVCNFLPFFVPVFIRKAMKVKYPGFFSSVYYGAGIITFPFFYLFQIFIIVGVFNLSWWIGFLLIPVFYFTGKFAFYVWYNNIMKIVLDFRLKIIREQQPEKFDRLLDLNKQISDLIVGL